MFAAFNMMMTASPGRAAFESLATGAQANATTLSWSHTIGAAAKALVVAVHAGAATLASPSATVGGTPMTLLSKYEYAANQYLMLFGLINPPTGAQTAVVTHSGAPYAGGTSLAYTGVSSFGTPVTSTGSGAAASLTVTSAAGQRVVQIFGNQGITAGAGAFTSYNQTSRYTHGNVSSAAFPTLIGDAPGASSVSFTAALPSQVWGGLAVPLIP
jgi:hypothetical protein